MFPRSKIFLLIALTSFMACSWKAFAGIDLNPANPKPMVADQPSEEELSDQNSFVKPYEYEREALGYDPDGIIYRENQPEDFQVVFITAMPFSALASFGLTGLTSVLFQGQFSVGGDFFWPFVGGVVAGAAIVASVSVLSNPYPPPENNSIVELPGARQSLVFSVPLVTARF